MTYIPPNPNGQTTMANSSPVVVASNQSAIPVSGTFWQATQPVSFTWAGLTDTELRASAVPVSLTSTTVTGTVAVTQSGTWNIGSISTLPSLPTGVNTIGGVNLSQYTPVSGRLPVDSSGVTQPISASSLPLPSGAATEATLTSGAQKAVARGGAKGTTTAADVTSTNVDANTQALDVAIKGTPAVSVSNASLPVTFTWAGLTDTQLRASAVPVSLASSPLPAGAATETTLSSINTKSPALGQAAMAASSPVVIASNQTAIPISRDTLTPSAPTSVTVGVASGVVLASTPTRRGLYLRNTSTAGQRISLHLNNGAAVLDSGITLETGDAFLMDNYTLSTAAINGIASAASARLSVQEFT